MGIIQLKEIIIPLQKKSLTQKNSKIEIDKKTGLHVSSESWLLKDLIDNSTSYICSYCSICVTTSSYPTNSGCCSGDGGCTGHSWREIK